MSGIEAIAAERKRQIEAEGWDHAHDAEHSDGSLAVAAACYALTGHALHIDDPRGGGAVVPFWSVSLWPWDRKWWKPKDRRRDLVRAGALTAAEIDRLDLAATR